MLKEIWNKYKASIIAIFASLALICTFLYQHHQLSVKSQEIAQYEQNWKAANDTLRLYRLKNNELLAAKEMYILNEKDLLDQLNMTKSELKDMQSNLKDKVTTISKVETVTLVDTIYMNTNVNYVSNDSINADFNYTDKWVNLDGTFVYTPDSVSTILNSLQMNTPLTIGVTKDYQFFVTSTNPYFHVTDITAGVIEKYVPKKKHWSVGLNAGFGAFYDINKKSFGYGPGVSLGLQYNF